MRVALCLTFLIAVLLGPSASAAQPEVIERDPYYLGLHEPRGEAPRGTVLMLHGGGWRSDLGSKADTLMESYVKRIRGWGFSVANLGYRPGSAGLEDTEAAFAQLRDRLGPDEPICIFGSSSGAQLGLMVAARREDVDCVIDLLGPSDLADFGSRPRSGEGEDRAREAFGASRLAELSPINQAEEIAADVLVGAATCDELIGVDRKRAFVDAMTEAGGRATLSLMDAGDDVDLEHCTVSQASFDRFLSASRELLASAGRPRQPIERADPAQTDPDDSSSLAALAGAVVAIGSVIGLVIAWRR